MAELTLEQQRALALARARVRVQKQQAAEKQKPKKPQETGFLQDLADVGGKLGQAVIDIAKPGQYIAQRAFSRVRVLKLACSARRNSSGK